MSTYTNNVLFQNQSLVAIFRAWVQVMHDGLTSVGLVQTSDTGQALPSTIALPGASTFSGFEIYRFADSLQATKPVFIKMEYGTAPNNTGSIFRVTLGTSTNGAGTLTGQVTPSPTVTGQWAVVDTSSQPAYFSGDTSSFTVAWPSSNATGGWRPSMVMAERTRNADGTPNGDAVVFAVVQDYGFGGSAGGYGDTSASVVSYLNNSVGTRNSLPIASPGQVGYWDAAGTTNGLDNNLFPFLVITPKQEAQMLSVLGCYASALVGQQTAQVTVLGAVHTYLSLGSQHYAVVTPGPAASLATVGGSYGANSQSQSLLMRYE